VPRGVQVGADVLGKRPSLHVEAGVLDRGDRASPGLFPTVDGEVNPKDMGQIPHMSPSTVGGRSRSGRDGSGLSRGSRHNDSGRRDGGAE
jgi:hypothetical protein